MVVFWNVIGIVALFATFAVSVVFVGWCFFWMVLLSGAMVKNRDPEHRY